MDKVKRCPFCGHKLNSEGYCENKNCVDYERTKIKEEEGKKK